MTPAGGPVRLAGWDWVPCWWLGALRTFAAPPTVLVLHCGDHRPGVAEYMADPVDPLIATPGGGLAPANGATVCKDGKARRQVATHFAWHAGRGRFVQQIGLERAGWGTGSSEWRGARLNRIALHVELPGPPDQSREGLQLGELVRLAAALRVAVPTLSTWLRHSDVDAGKRDPGPGVPANWAGGMLRYCPS